MRVDLQQLNVRAVTGKMRVILTNANNVILHVARSVLAQEAINVATTLARCVQVKQALNVKAAVMGAKC